MLFRSTALLTRLRTIELWIATLAFTEVESASKISFAVLVKDECAIKSVVMTNKPSKMSMGKEPDPGSALLGCGRGYG